MNSTEQEIRKELRKFVETFAPTLAESATVKSVNKEEYTCVLQSLQDDTEYTANLFAGEAIGGFVCFPKVGSVVFTRQSDNNTVYISQYGEIESVVFMQGALGGLVKVESILDKLNKIEEAVNKIINAFNNWTPVPNDGGAALKTVLGVQTILTKTTKEEIENEKIKQ